MTTLLGPLKNTLLNAVDKLNSDHSPSFVNQIREEVKVLLTYEDLYHLSDYLDCMYMMLGVAAIHAHPNFKEQLISDIQITQVTVTNILQDIQDREEKAKGRGREIPQ